MMKKTNFRILLTGILLLFLMIVASIYFLNQEKKWTRSDAINIVSKPQNISVDEYIETSPNEFSVYKGNIASGKTALDFLKNTTQVKTEGEGENAFVVEINGRMADNSRRQFWSFYVNDKQAQVGAGSYLLKPGDIIKWKIETY